MNVSKSVARKPALSILFVLLVAVASVAAAELRSAPDGAAGDSATRSVSASVSCSFLGPGRRGFCSAQPRGTGFIYNFYTSGPISIASGPLTSPYRSASCNGPGSITVVVTDPAGNTGSASTSTSCGGH